MTIDRAALGDIAEFINGAAFKPEDWSSSGSPIIRIQNLTNPTKAFNRTNRVVKETLRVLPGDLLVSWSATLGVFEWQSDEVGLLNQHIFRVLPRESVVDKRYLRHILGMALGAMSAHLHGATMKHVNRAEFLSTQIPLPPIAEQRRIADILDHADLLRARRRESAAMLGDLASVLFLDMFGDPARNPRSWPLVTLGSLAAKFSDGPFGSNLKSSHYVEDGVRVIRLQNIGVGKFIDEDRAYITNDHFSSLRKHECRPGDVLIGTLGDPNLRACIQPASVPLALNKADCVQMRVDTARAKPEYIAALLNQPSTAKMALSLTVGQTRLRISMGRLRTLLVPAPPVDVQHEFSAKVEAIESSVNSVFESRRGLDELYASLQERAFNGRI